MTNGEKYKTAKERAEAFRKYCDRTGCRKCELQVVCDDPRIISSFHWLDLDAHAEEPLPCPFCGGRTVCCEEWNHKHHVKCQAVGCWYCGALKDTYSEAIAAHNRVARAVKGVEHAG